MTEPDPLVAHLVEALTAAQHRYRVRLGTWAGGASPPASSALIEVLAAELAPVFRAAAHEAQRESSR